MAKKISALTSITAKQAQDASSEGYVPYIDPSETLASARNKKIVRNELKKLPRYVTMTTITAADYTLTAADQIAYEYFDMTNASAKTFNIPSSSTETFEIGMPIVIRNNSATDITIVPDGAVTLNGSTLTISQYAQVGLLPKAADEFDIIGGGSTGSSLTTLNAPGSFAADTPGETSCGFTFTDTNSSPNESSILVQVCDSAAFETTVYSDTPAADATTATVTGLTASTTYYARARAIGDGTTTSSSAWSSTISFTTAAVGGYDADAVNVINAIEATDAGALSTGEKDAINARIVALKNQGKWANMTAYYGYVGGTPSSHAINWKNPGTYDVTWAGGLTHSATGVLGNGTTGYGDTGINDNTVLTLDEVTIGGYVRTTNDTANGFMMGCLDGAGLYIADTATLAVRLHHGGDTSVATTPNKLIVASRQLTAPLVAVYRDGTQLTVASTASAGKVNGNIYLLAMRNVGTATTQGFSSEEYGSHFIYNGGFTAAEVTQFNTDEVAFQTALSRNV